MNSSVNLSRRSAFVLFAIGALVATLAAIAQTPGIFELWVGHELVDCPSDPARLCYQVKTEQYEPWSVFEGSITNFFYREGVAYVLLVEMDPSVDDSEPRQTRYKVVQILEEFETFSEPAAPDRRASTAVDTVEVEVPTEEVATAPASPVVEVVVPQPLPTTPDPGPVSEPEPMAPAPVETPVAKPVTEPPKPASDLGKPYRGILIIGSGVEARSFTPCGEEVGIWIEDQSDSNLWKVYRELVEAPNLPLLIDVRGEIGSAPSSGFGAHYDRQLTVFEVVGADTENTDCSKNAAPIAQQSSEAPIPEQPRPTASPTPGPPQLVISGGAPLWTLSIDSTGIVYSSPTSPETLEFPVSTPEQAGNRVTYTSTTSDSPPHSLKVVIDREPCPDAQTGLRREYTAYLTLDGRWLRGCVTAGDPTSGR